MAKNKNDKLIDGLIADIVDDDVEMGRNGAFVRFLQKNIYLF